MANTTLMCPGCGTVVQMEHGFFKKTMNCPKCSFEINIDKHATRPVICPHCKNDVIYDWRKGSSQLCPVCNEPLPNPAMKRFNDIPCPYCGVVNHVRAEDKTFLCAACGKKVSQPDGWPPMQTAYVIKVPDERDFLIWKHPLDRFPYASRVIVPDGVTALLLRNGICTAPAGPGDYPLQESLLSLGEQLESALGDPDQQITVSVYYVNDHIGARIKWGEPMVEVKSADGTQWGRLGAIGEIGIRVKDSRSLARFLNYQPCAESDVLWMRQNENSMPEYSRLWEEIRRQAFKGAVAAAQGLVQEGMELSEVSRRKQDIEHRAIGRINEGLCDLGLEVAIFSLANVTFEEDPASAERRNAQRQRAEAEQFVVTTAEEMNDWQCPALPVHQKGDPTLSAELVLAGKFKLRVTNRLAFLDRSDVARWVGSRSAGDEIRRSFAAQVSELIKNVFSDTLQPMIDDTGADVRELHRFFGYLRDSVQAYLNRNFERGGLTVEMFTLEQRALKGSSALEKLTAFTALRSETEIEQQAREYQRRIMVRDERDKLDTRTEMSKISDANAELDVQDAKRDFDAEQSIEEMKRASDQRREDWEQADEDASDARNHQKQMEQIARQAEQDAYIDEVRKQAGLRSIEEMRANWEAEQKLEEEKLRADVLMRGIRLSADIDEDARKQEAELDAKRNRQSYELDAEDRVAERDRRALLEDKRNQSAISDILRRISESDLELQQKLDAYARLAHNAMSQDSRENLVGDVRAKSEADYIAGHVKGLLSREQAELDEKLARLAEDRDERRREAELRRGEELRQAQFRRDMEQEKTRVANEMSRLQAEFEQKNTEAALRQELEIKDRELEKLRLTLTYYENKGWQGVDSERIRQEAESARKQAEMDYRLKNEQRDAEREERRERERQDREKGFSEQSERLLVRMWEIQEALQKMQMQTEQMRNSNEADVRKAQATAEQQRIAQQQEDARRAEQQRVDELVKSFEEMAESVRSSVKQMGKDIQENIQENIQGKIQDSLRQSGWTRGSRPSAGLGRACPNCGALVGKYDTYCSSCRAYLGN